MHRMMIVLIAVLFVASVPCLAQSDPQSVVADSPRRVLPAPRITSLEITGVEQLDAAHLLSRLDVHVGDPFDRETLLFQMDVLHSLLVDQGYATAKVDEPTVTNDGGNVSLQIHVWLGALFRIGTVSVSEPAQVSSAEILRLFNLHTGDVVTTTMVDAGMCQIREAYEKQGYNNVQVSVERVPQPVAPDEREGVVDFRVSVDVGPTATMGSIYFEGLSDSEASVLRSELPIREGDTYSTVALQEALLQLQKNGRLPAGALCFHQLADDRSVVNVTVRVVKMPPN